MNQQHSTVLRSLAERRLGGNLTALHSMYNIALACINGADDAKLTAMTSTDIRIRRLTGKLSGTEETTAIADVLDTKTGAFINLQKTNGEPTLRVGTLWAGEFTDPAQKQGVIRQWA